MLGLGTYRSKVVQAFGRVDDEVIDIFLLLDKAVVPAETYVCCYIPSNYTRSHPDQ